ncbi:MAG: tetratricopeptide repeat protein [Bacteroidia bacterium]
MKKIFEIIRFTFLMLLISSFVFAQSGKKKKSKDNIGEDQRIALEKTFLNANKEKILGNDDKAVELFQSCLKIDENNAASMYELSRILERQKKSNEALEMARGAAKIDPDNEWYLQQFGELLQQTGNSKEAVIVYKQLLKLHPENPDYYLMCAAAYMFDGKPEEAIKVYDDLEEKYGIDPDITREKQRIWLKLGKVDKAAEELERLIKKYPSEVQYYAMLVDLYQANNMNDKAYDAILRMEKVAPNHPAVALSLAEYYRSKGEKDKSFEQLKKAFANRELQSEMKLKVMISYMGLAETNDTMLTQALTLSKIFVETNGEEAMSHAMYGDFLSLSKNDKDARDQYREAVKIDSKNFQLWRQLVQASAALNDYNTLVADSKEALTLFPDQPLLYYFNGFANGVLKNYDIAIKTLTSGYKLVVDNDNLMGEFYAVLGDNYNSTRNYKESDNFYDKALKINPKNIIVLNNWAYYLSLRKDQLDKAAEMSKLSNELSPDNETYQDTYAWVLFQQGKYADAKEWQEKAIKNSDGKNGTLLEHYADILFKSGDVEKAVEFWKKAKAAGEASEQIDKKIAERKYVE